MKAIAARLGCTEGQLQTIAVGLAVALVAAITGLPPVLRDRPDVELAAPAAPLEQTPTTPTTAPPVAAGSTTPSPSASPRPTNGGTADP